MDAFGNILRPFPLLYLPPPPRGDGIETPVSKKGLRVITAYDKGFRDDVTPTSFDVNASPTEIRESLRLLFFRSFNITQADIRLAYHPDHVSSKVSIKTLLKRCDDYRSEFGNAVLSTTGPSTQDEWLARFLIGHVSLHDYEVRFHEIQRLILIRRLVVSDEREEAEKKRQEEARGLRLSFWEHQDYILERIEAAKQEARSWLTRDKEYRKSRGRYDLPGYMEYLNGLEKKFKEMDFWEQRPGSLDDIPERRRNYSEMWEVDNGNADEFWLARWKEKGMAYSFWQPFEEVLVLEPCLTDDQCGYYMQWLFCAVCHHAYSTLTCRLVENKVLASKQLTTPSGQRYQMSLDHRKIFEYVRDLLERCDFIPTTDHIFVRESDIPGSTKKREHRGNKDHPAPKRRIPLSFGI